MIIINTVDSKYFTLDGIQFARIYQPLAQGSAAIGLYNKFDTKQQLKNSTKYDEFSIDSVVYGSQEETIVALLGVVYSGVSEYSIEQLEQRVENLEENQYSGVKVYSTFAELPVTGTLLVSYKVSNDPDSSKNGYYHWDGAAYVKDANLVKDVVLLENKSEGVSGYAVEERVKQKANLEVGKNKANINDPDTAEDFYINYQTGELVSLADYNVTSFIPVLENTNYYLSFKSDIAWYDKNKNYISGSSSSDSNKSQLSPVNAVYLRCTVYYTSWNSFQVEIGSSGTAYEAYKEVLLESNINIESTVEESNKTKPVTGKAIVDYIEPVFEKVGDKEIVRNGVDSGVSLVEYFSGSIWGWGSQQKCNLGTLRYFKIIRDSTLSVTSGANVTCRLYGSNVEGDYGNEIKNFTFPIADYLALSDGDEFVVDVGSPVNVSGYLYVTLILFYDAGLSVKQTKDLHEGFYTVDGVNVLVVTPPTYGLWWGAVDELPFKVGMKINAFEVPELEGYSGILGQAKVFSNVIDKPDYLNVINKGEDDFYLMLYGDSITAWQSTLVKAEQGVCDVPPVCDRKGFANRVFDVLKFGNPIYKRFDWGKESLVAFWNDRWVDDSNAFFMESGSWKTFYRGGEGRPANIYTAPGYTTEITNEICPISDFHEVDWQRNIPKRISNSASAYIEFVVPANYGKFDFVYHEHVDGDSCVVSITEGSGKVIVNTLHNDWGNGVEANGYNLNTLKQDDPGGFNDAYGVLQKRLHFEKLDRAEAVTVRITKSSNTAKWLMYWGVSYWGTKAQPNALHLVDNGRGGYSIGSLLDVRGSDLGGFNIDGLLFENTLINSLGTTGVEPDGSKKNQSGYRADLDTLHSYLNGRGIEIYHVIPHLTKTVNDANPQPAKEFYNGIKGYLVEDGRNVFDIENVFRGIWELFYENEITYSEFIKILMYDTTTHPNEKGFDVFEAFLRKLI